MVEPSLLECKVSENNVKINYPSTWTRTYDNSKPPVKVIIFTSPKEGPADRILESVVVGVDDTVGNLTLDTYIHDFIRNMRKGLTDFKLIESTPSTLSGFAAHQIIFSSSQLKELHVATIKNKVLYWIMYVAEREKYDKFLYAAEQMISSFELLE